MSTNIFSKEYIHSPINEDENPQDSSFYVSANKVNFEIISQNVQRHLQYHRNLKVLLGSAFLILNL